MNNRGRPASSAPCNLLGSMTRPTCTPGDSPLIRAPSAWVTDTVAMVIVGSLPPSPGGGLAVVLLAMITALAPAARSEEHTSELQSLMRISYAVFCLKKKNRKSNIYATLLY